MICHFKPSIPARAPPALPHALATAAGDAVASSSGPNGPENVHFACEALPPASCGLQLWYGLEQLDAEEAEVDVNR